MSRKSGERKELEQRHEHAREQGNAASKSHVLSEEKQSVLRIRAWEIFGFGSQYAWLFSLTFGSALYGIARQESLAWDVRISVVVGTLVAYFAFFLMRGRFSRRLFSRRTVLGSGILGTLATFTLAWTTCVDIEPFARIALLACLALVCGFMSAIMMLGGNDTWSYFPSERVILHITVSTVAAAGLVTVMYLLPALAGVILTALMPTLGGVILSNTRRGRRRPSPASSRANFLVDSSDEQHRPKHSDTDGSSSQIPGQPLKSSTVVRVGVHVGTYAFVLGCVIGLFACRDVEQWGSLSLPAMVMVLGVCVAMMLVSMRFDPTLTLRVFSELSFPLILSGLILLAVLGIGGNGIGWMLTLSGFVLSDLFMWFVNYQIVVRTGQGTLDVLARSATIEWGCLATGMLIGRMVFENVGHLVLSEGAVSFLCVSCCMALIFEHTVALTPIETARLISDRQDALGMDALDAACLRLAQRCGLSSRESDVLALLAHGRSVPYIGDELGLSQSTVKTHISAIYRKVGVKGRQQLLDLVEQAIAE
jgi:DNA-binding CsgD family transcriptional regulator